MIGNRSDEVLAFRNESRFCRRHPLRALRLSAPYLTSRENDRQR
jgi:hypothetical protein